MMETPRQTSKDALRAAMLARRRDMPPLAVQAASAAVVERLLGLDVWGNVREALLYLPVRNEIDATALLAPLWERGVKTLVPRCRKDAPGHMDLACIDDLGQTCPGSFGVLEPHENLCLPPERFSPELVLAPGVAFDRSGARIGFGGGYYDRLLSKPEFENALTIGLAHAFQLVERLPSDPWDRPVGAVCTDEEMLWIKK